MIWEVVHIRKFKVKAGAMAAWHAPLLALHVAVACNCNCNCNVQTPRRRVNPRRGHSPAGEFVCARGADAVHTHKAHSETYKQAGGVRLSQGSQL